MTFATVVAMNAFTLCEKLQGQNNSFTENMLPKS
ncbi:hypothetical protein Bhyg_12446 [Pseudolycoriella hygida]|uniref:Uncharacterized protein n=1 Tax=Pseudolycoriella hygida TaxID=35572 RepID=A0A9Q0MYW2_9DIPT|nr:hypothetical protein Bhyg_12446 [Pseudolycoriella hygida]